VRERGREVERDGRGKKRTDHDSPSSEITQIWIVPSTVDCFNRGPLENKEVFASSSSKRREGEEEEERRRLTSPRIRVQERRDKGTRLQVGSDEDDLEDYLLPSLEQCGG